VQLYPDKREYVPDGGGFRMLAPNSWRLEVHPLVTRPAILALALLTGLIGCTSDGAPAGGESSGSVPTNVRATCDALFAADELQRGLMDGYERLIELGEPERIKARHQEILAAMLAISSELFGTSSDESQFSDLELAIGDWMSHWDAAMTSTDSAYRLQDDQFLNEAAQSFALARNTWLDIEDMRVNVGC